MAEELVCWNCGASLTDQPLPLARLAECRACEAELHVCRQCRFYAPRHAEHCVEDRADPPLEKGRANFCDYFEPNPDAWQPPESDGETERARAELEALFGGPDPRSRPDSGEEREDERPLSEAEQARRTLERMFGGKRS